MTLPYDAIIVKPRLRQDYGNIDELVESIETLGLIQPLAVKADGELVAGGRRYAAITKIREKDPSQFITVPVHVLEYESNSDADSAERELEENLRRQNMTWQEQAIGLAKIHKLRETHAHKNSLRWTTRQTGDLFGVSHTSILYAVALADEINKGNESIINCTSSFEAVQLIISKRRKELEKEQANRKTIQAAATQNAIDLSASAPTESSNSNSTPVITYTDADVKALRAITFASGQLHCQDSMDWMSKQPPNSFGGIYTDIPYGIEMDHINMKHVAETASEHDRDSNIDLFIPFLRNSYRILMPGCFCVFWCDIEHKDLLTSIAKDAGFRVQRWPLIAQKHTACKNEAASYNTTKDYEVLLVCAKEGAVLATKRNTSFVPFLWDANERNQFTHPFAKPHSAHEHVLKTFFPAGTNILDPFCGEGTGVLSAFKLGYKPTGIDLVESHVIRARKHLEAAHLKQND